MTEAPGGEDTSVLLCVTGSIAASGAVSLLQLMVERRKFSAIHVALSKNALHFVREEPLAVLARRPCITDLYQGALEGRAVHVDVAQACGIAVVAPATADVIAKLAHGLADDTVTTMLSVFEGHRILVPAVHRATSRTPSFERNLAQVRDDGFMICGPVPGYSMSEDRRSEEACAMPEADFIVAFVEYVALTGKAPDIDFHYPGHRLTRFHGGDR